MIARVTLAEIDTVRMSVAEAIELFRSSVVPALHEQEGYEGVYVLLTPEGKALVLTFWADEESAEAGLHERLLRRAGREVRDDVPSAARACDVRRRARRCARADGRGSAMTKIFGLPGRRPCGRPRASCSCWPRPASQCSRCGTASSSGSGVRNLTRRRGRTALIVVGLMLGTTIISAALATGDTMSHTIRSSATAALGQTDEVDRARKGIDAALASGGGSTGCDATSRRATRDRIARDTARSGPGRRRAAGDHRARRGPGRHEPPDRAARDAVRDRDPAAGTAFGDIRDRRPTRSRSAGSAPGRGLPQPEGRRTSSTRSAGDTLQVLAGRPSRDGDASQAIVALRRQRRPTTPRCCMPLAAAQQLLGKPGLVKAVFVSNTRRASGADSGDASSLEPARPRARPRGRQHESRTRSSRPTQAARRSCRSSRRSARSRSRPGSC